MWYNDYVVCWRDREGKKIEDTAKNHTNQIKTVSYTDSNQCSGAIS